MIDGNHVTRGGYVERDRRGLKINGRSSRRAERVPLPEPSQRRRMG